MAGISVPQYEIFKIGTDKLKYSDWNLSITKHDAFRFQEIVSLFEGQHFRIMAEKILKQDIKTVDFSKIFIQVVIDRKTDFERVAGKNGINVNGINYRRFVGTTGGLKNNTVLLCNSKYIDRLNDLCECRRNMDIMMVPAKYEAYKALTCSASQPVCQPDGILVVKDCITKYVDDIILLDDSSSAEEPERTFVKGRQLENNVSDGLCLCTFDYMKRISESLSLDYVPGGVCIRNAWTKGMLYPFPISEFVEKYRNGNYMVTDIWGNTQDIRKCDVILTESSLKMWYAYDSIDDYVSACKECGYGFSVTKITPHTLDEQRELNYQYLQSYEFSDDDIKELCDPTIQYLKDSMCGNYSSTVRFLGITENTDVNSWQRALYLSEYMLGDPYIIDSAHRFIKKKINDAKIGRLFVDGNYQIASGDPFALMQSLCGLDVTGLMGAGECYSEFWDKKGEDDVVIFRSPMTCHNNIRKCMVSHSDECRYWYRYMNTIMVINAWDSFCRAENGADWDGDILFSTNNRILKKNYRKLPAIECIQRNTKKVLITEKEIKRTNKNGMGNQVGTITNYITSMMEVQSHFDPGSREYMDLEYRIECGQLMQQNELDKLKGIVAKPMPGYWYNMRACGDSRYLQSICAYRKPYFMIYIYGENKAEYRKYIKDGNNKCMTLYGKSVDDLYNTYGPLPKEQSDFLFWYEYKMPVGTGDCSMNRICRYVESQLDGYKLQLQRASSFDYSVLKTERRCTSEHYRHLSELEKYYCDCVKEYKKKKYSNNKRDTAMERNHLCSRFRKDAADICPNDDERLNIILDITYKEKGNRQFCWDTAGELICQRLEGLDSVHTQ